MLSIKIAALFVLMERTYGGYIHPHLQNTLKLPKIEPNFHSEIQQKTIQEPQQTIESVESYSVPFQNYYNLREDNFNLLTNIEHASKEYSDVTINQQNKLKSLPDHILPTTSTSSHKVTSTLNNQHNNVEINSRHPIIIPVINLPFNQNNNYEGSENLHTNNPTISTVKVTPLINEQSISEVNNVKHIEITADDIPNVSSFASIKHQSNSEFHAEHTNIPAFNIQSVNAPSLVQLQNNLEFTMQQPLRQGENRNLNSPINIQKIVSPKITKHVYFHVPPPDIEEPVVRTIIPKVEDYKIIFIKAPSQERNIGFIQENAFNQIAPVDEKTIIYVLSKNPSTQQAVSKVVPSEHEVFYVKYNGNTGTAVAQISDNL